MWFLTFPLFPSPGKWKRIFKNICPCICWIEISQKTTQKGGKCSDFVRNHEEMMKNHPMLAFLGKKYISDFVLHISLSNLKKNKINFFDLKSIVVDQYRGIRGVYYVLNLSFFPISAYFTRRILPPPPQGVWQHNQWSGERWSPFKECIWTPSRN